MGCLPPHRLLLATSRCGSLLLFLSADARFADDAIAFEGPILSEKEINQRMLERALHEVEMAQGRRRSSLPHEAIVAAAERRASSSAAEEADAGHGLVGSAPGFGVHGIAHGAEANPYVTHEQYSSGDVDGSEGSQGGAPPPVADMRRSSFAATARAAAVIASGKSVDMP